MATWRDHPYSYKGYLFVLQPEMVFAARVNQASFDFDLMAELTYDTVTTGAFGDTRPGMLLTLGTTAAGDDLGRSILRKASTSTKVFPGWSSKGSHDGELYPGDNVYITVWNFYPVYSKIPRITQDEDGIVYKDFELEMGDYGSEPPPVANGGVGYAGFVNAITGLITVVLDGSGSFATADGATITDYLWEEEDGTVTAGSLTAAAVTLTFEEGFRFIHLTVTDSNDQTHTCHIPIYAATTEGENAPVNAYEVRERTLRPEGQSLGLRVLTDIPASSYFDGTLVMYWEDESFNGVHGSLYGPTGRKHMKFIGWMQRDSANIRAEREGLKRDSIIECVDAAGRLATLPGFPLEVRKKSSPDEWHEMSAPHIDKYMHYLLQWHTTALDVTDFQWSGLGEDYYPFKRLGSDGENLYRQVDKRGRAFAHRFTCDSFGRLWAKPDPQLLDAPGTPATTATRTTEVAQDIDETDWTDISYEHRRAPVVHWLRGYAVIATAGRVEAVRCVAPGDAPSQGESAREQDQQLATSQEELNAWTGHQYARMNAPEGPYRVELAHGGDAGFEPAHMHWARMTISVATAAQRGLSFTDARFLVQEVNIRYRSEREGRTKQVSLRLERETVGLPAKTVPVITASDVPTFTPGYSLLPTPTVISTIPGQAGLHLYKGVKKIAMWGTGGYLVITNNFDAVSPTWVGYTFASLGISGTLHSAVVDAFSSGYLGTGTSVDCWVVTSTGVYLVSDIFGAKTVSLKRTITTTATSIWGCDSPFDVAGKIAIIHDRLGSGVQVDTSTNYGAAWTSVASISGFANSTAGERAASIVWSTRVTNLLYAGAPVSAGGNHRLYKSTNAGVSWALVGAGIGAGYLSFRGLHIPWHDNTAAEIVYFGQQVSAGANSDATTQIGNAGAGTTTDISPTISAVKYGATRLWGIDTCVTNRQRVLAVAERVQFGVGFEGSAVFSSLNGGTTWSVITNSGTSSPRYRSIHFGGNDEDVFYIWGDSGAIGYCQNFTTIENKQGNLLTAYPSVGNIVRIMGG